MLRRVRSANLNPAFLRRLFSYAGWVAVSNFIAPLLSQVDRYLIAAIVTVEAVTFYAVPYETLNALWIVPGSIAAALFPAFSGLRTRNEQDFNSLYARPIKYILVLLGPAVLVMMVFANDILRFWQGPLFAEKSSLVLQILVLGVLINSVEWVPANLLMGFDRPDLTAICHLIQLPLYLGTAYLLIARWGIVGAAAAFALRVTFEAVFVFIASWRQAPGVWRSLGERKLLDSLVLITLLAVVLIGARALRTEGLMQIGLAILGLLAFAGATWIFVLDRFDRRLILSLLPITRREAA
jgi:O-antigen/teichoic acid export membrane protein